MNMTFNPKQEEEALRKHISKIVDPIFNKALQEAQLTPLSVGSQQNPILTFTYIPHNYRLYYQYSKVGYNPKLITDPKKKTHRVGSDLFFNPKYTYTPINYGKEHRYRKFMFFFDVTVKKNQIEIRSYYNHKKEYKLEASTLDEIQEKIFEISKEREAQANVVLQEFIKQHGGVSDLRVLNTFIEAKIKQEEFIDTLPYKARFHIPDIGKKVYKSDGFEFVSEAKAVTYLQNQALKKIAPDIAIELEEFTRFFKEKFLPVQKEFMISVDVHNKVLKGIDKSFKKFNKLLSQKTLKEWI